MVSESMVGLDVVANQVVNMIFFVRIKNLITTTPHVWIRTLKAELSTLM